MPKSTSNTPSQPISKYSKLQTLMDGPFGTLMIKAYICMLVTVWVALAAFTFPRREQLEVRIFYASSLLIAVMLVFGFSGNTSRRDRIRIAKMNAMARELFDLRRADVERAAREYVVAPDKTRDSCELRVWATVDKLLDLFGEHFSSSDWAPLLIDNPADGDDIINAAILGRVEMYQSGGRADWTGHYGKLHLWQRILIERMCSDLNRCTKSLETRRRRRMTAENEVARRFLN